MSQDRFNDLNRALRFMLAKARCRGYTLSCFLGEDALDGMAGPLPLDDAAAGELVVNPTLYYEPRGDTPPEIRRRVMFTDALLRGFPLAWIEDSATQVWLPFWIRGEWVAVLESLRPGAPAPTGLTPHQRQTLARAKILVAPHADRERRAAWKTICLDAAARHGSYGYAIVRDVIHPAFGAAMRHYYRALLAGGRLPVGDNQVAERQRLHSEPVAMFLHRQLASLVSRIAGEPVKPSYTYFASYPAGSVLPRHVDREQCEFSVSLLVDYTPDPGGPSGWPLFLEHPRLPDGVVAADLAVGDAVFYRGRELTHYRDALPAGHRSSSVFLHYVRPDFAGKMI